MKTYTNDELQKILKQHKMWLNYNSQGKRADLSGADLSAAYLFCANLSGADLFRANLSDADLSGANLSDKDISYVQSFTNIVPNGEIEVYKATAHGIATLIIPKEAKRINYIGSRKCRAEYAKVVSIIVDGKKVKRDNGKKDNEFVYEVEKIAKPDKFDPNPLVECSNGIHFFLTKLEAERWLNQ